MDVLPAASVRGAAAVPGDKSISHRAVLVGAVCDGEVEVHGFGRSLDTEATLDAAKGLGVEIAEPSPDVLVIQGVGLRGLREPSTAIDCRNAGTLARLLPGLLVGQESRCFTLTGDESLSTRPMGRIAVPLRAKGARVEMTGDGLPLTVEGAQLTGIEHQPEVASAQVKSCVLLAGMYARGETVVVEPVPTRDHTERMLRAAGASVVRRGHRVSIRLAERLGIERIDVPGDVSSSAPFVLAATLLSGSELILRGIGVNPARTGFLDVLERMGARISIFNRRVVSGEPVADLEVVHAELVATEIGASEVPGLIDELPLFCLAAAVAHGTSTVRGAGELRRKESDRIATVAQGLRAIGLHVAATRDGFRIRGVPARPRGGTIDAAGDHRIAMLGTLAGLVSREGVHVRGAECAAVSFPGFFDLVDSLAQR